MSQSLGRFTAVKLKEALSKVMQIPSMQSNYFALTILRGT